MSMCSESEGSFEVYYESIKREPKIRGINKCRCDERLQTKTKEFTRLPYTGLVLEQLKHEEQGSNIFFLVPHSVWVPRNDEMGHGRLVSGRRFSPLPWALRSH